MIWTKFTFLFLLLTYSLTSHAEQSTADEKLFAQVFKKRFKEKKITLPLYSENSELDEVVVIIASQNKIKKIDTPALLHNLTTLVLPAKIKEMRNTLPSPWCTPVDLRKFNISLLYDYQNLLLKLNLPLDLKKARPLDFSTFQVPKWVKNPQEPTGVSAYTNIHLYKTLSNIESYRQDTLDFRSVIDINQFVLEGNFSYQKNGDLSYWQREDIFLTKDLVNHSARMTAGDLNYNTRGHQTYKTLMGIQFSREFSIHPYSTIYPYSSHEFTLKQRSEVELYINGNLVRTLILSRGKHSLRDLPLNQGINDVTLKIKDQTGREETLNFPAAMSFNLLKKGLHEFSYSFGLTSHYDASGSKSYQTDEPILNYFHYYGATNTLTTGHYGQFKKNYYLLGFENTYASNVGEFSLVTSLSSAFKKYGAATTLNYKFTWYGRDSKTPYDFSLQFDNKSPWFQNIDQSTPNVHSNILSTSFGHSFLDILYLRLGIRWTPAKDSTEMDFRQFSLSINKRIFRNFNTNLLLNESRNFDGSSEKSIAIYLNLLLPDSNQNIIASYDSSSNDQKISWDHNQAKKTDKFNSRVSLRKNGHSKNSEASLEYVHDRFTGRISNYINKSSSTTTQTKLNLNTSVVYSSGHWSLSRPISESFALIAFDKGFSDYTLYLNNKGNDYDSSSSVFNDLVISNLQDYRYTNFNIDSSDLPPGHSIGKEFYSLHSKYHSGNFIAVKNLFKTSAYGILVKSETPFALRSGEIKNIHSAQTWQFFTNRKGRFFVEGLPSGSYSIFSYDLEKEVGTFTIKKDQKGFLNLGKITFPTIKRNK